MADHGQALAPSAIVHGLPQAHAVLRAAAGLGRPVTLLSAQGAACYAGVGWWQALVAAARLAQPGCVAADVLDCGEAPGRALEALRARQKLLVLRARADIWADIAARAAAQDGVLLAAAPLALDMAARGAARRLAEWLTAGV